MAGSGHKRRVIVVTSDASLIEPLRDDDRLDIVAHLESAGLARTLLSATAVDAVLVDDQCAAEFSGGNLPAGPGGSAPEVFILRSMPGWEGRTGCPSRPETLRDWWLESRGRARPGGGPSLPLPPTNPGAGLARPSPALVPEVLMRQVIAVVSPKGGVGKTFVSVNLAASLSRYTGFRVILLDLDLHSGDAAVHLDLLGSPTLAELLPYAGSLEPGHLGRAVVSHGPSRLDVLLAPAKPEAAELMAREHLGALLRAVKQEYDFVVIDTPPDPADPLVAECLKECSAAIVVSSLDAAALRQCRLFLDGLARLGPRGHITLLLALNQVHDGGPLPPAGAQAFLEAGVAGLRTFHIPEDRSGIERAVFEGRPLVLSDPGHPAARAVFGLADCFCPVFGDLLGNGRQRRGGLGRLLGAIRKW